MARPPRAVAFQEGRADATDLGEVIDWSTGRMKVIPAKRAADDGTRGPLPCHPSPKGERCGRGTARPSDHPRSLARKTGQRRLEATGGEIRTGISGEAVTAAGVITKWTGSAQVGLLLGIAHQAKEHCAQPEHESSPRGGGAATHQTLGVRTRE
jgi:hypothetical protein